MKKIVFILLALLPIILCFSQTLENDSLNLEIKRNNLGGSVSTDRYPNLKERNIFDDQSSIKQDKSIVSSDFETTDTLRMNMHIYVPQFYQGPLHDYLSESRYPFANDYAYYAGYRISDRSWLTTSSTYGTYPLMGNAQYIGGTYNYMLADNLTLSTGAYISKYVIGLKDYNDMGANANLKYQITDRIAVHGFGRYSVFARDHKLDSSFAPWYPSTGFGGAFEYKVNDRFGIMGGMERQLNPMTGKWNNIPFIAPIFYGK